MKLIEKQFSVTPRVLARMLVLLLIFPCLKAAGEDNQILIVDNVSTNFPGYPFLIGDTGTNNHLIITNGGSATSAGIWIGNAQSATLNGMLVTGTNSNYQGPLFVGNSGSQNELRILNGGSVTNNSASIGEGIPSSNNFVVVDGSNSVWTVTVLDVGRGGSSNCLVVANGGRVNASGMMGGNVGDNNLVEIIGSGSVWNGGLFLGGGGRFNKLVISGGGQLTNGNVSLGIGPSSSNNVVFVTDLNSKLNVDFVKIGQSGSSNTLAIENGGTVVSIDGYIGMSRKFNTTRISGTNSTWTVQTLWVGYQSSDSSLRISDGGRVNASSVFITGFSDSNNIVQISKGILVASNLFSVATGPLEINDGECWAKQLTCDRATGGQILLNSGSLIVTQFSTLTYGTNSLTIGTTLNSTGTVQLLPGSHTWTASGGIFLGKNLGSRGEFYISGSNTVVRGPLYVGDTDFTDGSGFASITSHAVLEANTIFSGTNNSGVISNNGGIFQFTVSNPNISNLSANSILLTNGTISFRDVTNVDPRFILPSPTNILFSGTNTLRLLNSSTIAFQNYEFGNSSNLVYTRLLLTNGTTRWSSTNLVINQGGELFATSTVPTIGVSGGTVIVTNGGKIRNFVASVDFNRSASNVMFVVSGINSVWTNSSDFALGRLGASNQCVIESGGRLQNQIGYIGFDTASSNNSLTVRGSGSAWINTSSLSVGNFGKGNVLSIEDDGEVRCSQMTIGVNTSSVSNTVQVSGGGLIVTNSLANAVLEVRRGSLTVSGGEIKADHIRANTGSAGKINFYSGNVSSKQITINNGAPFIVGDGIHDATLWLEGGAFSFANGLVISSNAVLRGYGTIMNNVTNHGTIIADQPGEEMFFQGSLSNTGQITTTNGGGISGAFLKIVQMSKTGNSAQVSVQGIRGLAFSLEYKNSIFDPGWTPLLPFVQGTNATMILTDPDATEPMRVYRMRAE